MNRRSAAIILAAGSGLRMRQSLPSNKNSLSVEGKSKFKKEFLLIDNKPILYKSVEAFLQTNLFESIVITTKPEDRKEALRILAPLNTPVITADGGRTRQESVLNSLIKILSISKQGPPDFVFIHDGARPFIRPEEIEKIYSALLRYDAVIPVTGSVNAMKTIDRAGKITEHLIRENTVSAQTPQAFRFDGILKAHQKAADSADTFIDDSEIWSRFVGDVHTVEGDQSNRKITFFQDLPPVTEPK